MELSKDDGEDFERANILLAKFYVDKVPILFFFYLLRVNNNFNVQAKNDLAQDLCKRCLMHNKSCSQVSFSCSVFVCNSNQQFQAWEVLGLAMEKEQDYEHSYECYEKVLLKHAINTFDIDFALSGMEIRV